MHRGRKSKGLPAENPRAFGERAAPSQLWRGGRLCAHTHVQEDTHVCTPCQGPVLTRRGGTLPRPGEEEEEEEGDAISGSLPTPAVKGTTPHTPPPSRCLHAWVSARSVIPSTPRRHLDREKAMQNQTKTHQNTPKHTKTTPTARPDGSPGSGEQQSPVPKSSPSPGRILHSFPVLSTSKHLKSWKNPPNDIPRASPSQRSWTPRWGGRLGCGAAPWHSQAPGICGEQGQSHAAMASREMRSYGRETSGGLRG